jgi:hypothetical protein
MRIHYNKFIILLISLFITVNIAGCSLSNDSSVPVDAPTQAPPLVSEPTIPKPLPEPLPEVKPEPIKLVEYTGLQYHVFFHSLIAFPEIAYSKVGQGSLDTDCVTPTEFIRTLNELYKNNYILIDINSTFEAVEENGQQIVKDKKLMLPEGKKPLIMSVDDMVYDPKKMGLGMVDKIILDKDGNFATYTKHKNGEEIISYDNEIIPILEQFIKEHHDFSFNGAKATLALTGWVGILGYRIDRLSSNRKSEIQAVKPIVDKLKERGWNFASHGYGHRHSSKISYNLFKDDTIKWHNEIEPIVGPTKIYVYPYGDKLSVSDAKYKLLLEYGFKVMCGVGSSNLWKNYSNSIFMDRHSVDGYSLRNNYKYLLPLLDSNEVFDAEGRKARDN